MSVSKARNLLYSHGDSGNWRFKGLLLAGMRESPVSAGDVAKAWPSAKKGEYRFLANHDNRDIDTEMHRTTAAESGTERFRALKDFAANADVPRTLGAADHINEEDGMIEARLDDAIPRMLFAASSQEEIDVLFREQLLDVIQEGREFRKVAREASDVINANTRRGDVTIASDEQFAPPISQGSEIRDDREQYTTVEWDCTKHGEGGRVTDEMRDQANVDAIERNMRFVGESVENAVNREFVRELIDNASNNHDTAGGNQGYKALNQAVTEVDKAGFMPNTYLTGSEYRGVLYQDTNLAYANRAGTDEVLRNREEAPIVGDIAGLDMHAASHEDVYAGEDDDEWPSVPNTFGFENDGELGGVIYDRNRIHTFLYGPDGNDIELKDYEDPIRDLNGFNARVHVDVQYSQQRSAATIEY
jgi:hypothetical protein